MSRRDSKNKINGKLQSEPIAGQGPPFDGDFGDGGHGGCVLGWRWSRAGGVRSLVWLVTASEAHKG